MGVRYLVCCLVWRFGAFRILVVGGSCCLGLAASVCLGVSIYILVCVVVCALFADFPGVVLVLCGFCVFWCWFVWIGDWRLLWGVLGDVGSSLVWLAVGVRVRGWWLLRVGICDAFCAGGGFLV